MCVGVGVSTQQWLRSQIALFERIRQSAWLDAVMTLVDKGWMNFCALKHIFLKGVQQQFFFANLEETFSPTRY